MAMALTSAAFPHGADIPTRFTCEGADESPALQWSGAPVGTKSFAVIADDPDAPGGTWVHWVAFNIPADKQALAPGMSKAAELDDGTRQGTNDFKRVGYGGPCPPPGKPHRYFFKLYALDRLLELPAGATKGGLIAAMEGHILGQAELMGKYKR